MPAEIGELAKRWARFAPLDEFRVFGDVSEVLVVAEPTVAEEMVDLVRREILEGVGPVWGIAAVDIRRGCGDITAEFEVGGVVDARRLELGSTVGRDGGVRLVFAVCALGRLVERLERIGEVVGRCGGHWSSS